MVNARSAALFPLTLAPLIWSTNFVVGRVVAEALPPTTTNLFRWLVFLALFAPIFSYELWRDRDEVREHLKTLAVLGFLGVAAFNTVLYTALNLTSASRAALIFASTPVFVLLFSRFGRAGRCRSCGALGLVTSIIGVCLILGPRAMCPFRQEDWCHVLGDGLVLVAAIIWALYTMALQKRPKGLSAGATLTATVILGVTMMLPLAAVELVRLDAAPSWPVVWQVTYLGLFASGLAFLLWERAVATVGSATAAHFLHLIPVFGTALGWLVLNEQLSLVGVVGAAFVVAGILAARIEPG